MVLHSWNHTQLMHSFKLPSLDSEMYEGLISDLSPQWFRYLQERTYGIDSENRPICLDPIIANWLKKDIKQMNLTQFHLLSLQERKYYLRVCLMLLTSTKGVITSIKENIGRFNTFNLFRALLGSEDVHQRLSPCSMMKDPSELIRKLDLFGTDYSGWFTTKEGELLLHRMVSLGTVGGNVLACELVHRGVFISFEMCMEIGEFGGLLYSIQESRVNGFKLKRTFEKISSEYIGYDVEKPEEHDTDELVYRTSLEYGPTRTAEQMLKELEDYDEAIMKDFVVVDRQLRTHSNETPSLESGSTFSIRVLERRIREMEEDHACLSHPVPEMIQKIKESKDLLEKLKSHSQPSREPVLESSLYDLMSASPALDTLSPPSPQTELVRETVINLQDVSDPIENPFPTSESFKELIEDELQRRQSLSIAPEDLDQIRQQLQDSKSESEEKDNEPTVLPTSSSDSDSDFDEDVEEQLASLLDNDDTDDIERQLQMLLRVTSRQDIDTLD